MSRIFTSFSIAIALFSLSIAAKAANIDVLAINQTTNMLTDVSAFAPPNELTKRIPQTPPDTFVSQNKTTISGDGKGTFFAGGNYKFRETSTLESMTFALICIGLIGLMAAHRFKRAFD